MMLCQSQFSETDLEAKHKWIYAVVPLSVGPVGPGGGIYSIIEDVVCKVYLQKTELEPNNSGYMQFCFYRTRVRSLVMLVTHSLTDSLTHSLPFSKLD